MATSKASEASASATTASSKASEASASAASAQTAQGLAESARDDAIDAKTDAETARDLAQQYAESIDPENIFSAYPTDTASGAVASFADGADDVPMKSVVVAIEPVQDLHGQASPYPAGGGKNLFDGSAVTTTVPNNWGVSFANNTLTIEHKNDYLSGAPSFMLTSLSSGTYVVSYTATQNEKCSLYNDSTYVKLLKSGTSFDTSEGDRIVFSANNNTTNTFTNFQLELGSTATSYAPYSNICPISGWTGANVVRTGVNVWDEEWESGYINNSTGEFVASQNYICTKNFISIVPGKSYYIKTPVALKLIAYDANKTFLRAITSTWVNEVITGSTHLSDVYYIKFYNAASGALTTYNHDISINYPATDTDYHPYTGNTYSITFPTEAGTVYGGELDVTNGTLTVDRAMVDLGTLDWYYNTSYDQPLIWAWLNDAKGTIFREVPNALCENYPITSPDGAKTADKSITVQNGYLFGGERVVAHDSSYSDDASFKTAMDGVQLCYELAEPITYHLTPTEIKSLLGDNNIWADAGDTEVIYRADPNLYIDKRIGTEAPMIATDNIVSGSYFMVGNNLYKATANIASGAAVVVGTNATAKTMAEALNEINA